MEEKYNVRDIDPKKIYQAEEYEGDEYWVIIVCMIILTMIVSM